jgi:hypothetical protein
MLLLKPQEIGPLFLHEDLKQELVIKSSSKHIDTVMWHNSCAPFIAGNGDLGLACATTLHMRRTYSKVGATEIPTLFQL